MIVDSTLSFCKPSIWENLKKDLKEISIAKNK